MTRNNIITLAALVSMFSGCSSVTREDFQEPYSTHLEEIIAYASLAGNTHNTQPWYVVAESDSVVHIHADFTRKLHIVDPDARGIFISLGAFIDNFLLAAESFGYNTQLTLHAESNKDSNVATIRLSRGNAGKDYLEKIRSRRTMRIPFLTHDISRQHAERITRDVFRQGHFFTASSDEGKFIAQQTFAAYTQQAIDEQAKQELASWIRFSNSDVKEHRDGLTTAGMGITGFGGFIVRNFYNPEDAMKESFVSKGIENTKEQVEHCGGWLVIVQEEDTPASWIETGRIYNRMNMKCRELMVGFHPMNQVIEEENFTDTVVSRLGLQGRIQFVARIGYVEEYPPANSVRRAVKEIIRYKK